MNNLSRRYIIALWYIVSAALQNAFVLKKTPNKIWSKQQKEIIDGPIRKRKKK